MPLRCCLAARADDAAALGLAVGRIVSSAAGALRSSEADELEASLDGPRAKVPRLCAAAPMVRVPEPGWDGAAQLVTGGTGGLGATTARWLAQRGTAAAVLTSRRGSLTPSAAGSVVSEARAACTLAVARCDGENASRALLTELASARPLGMQA